MSNQQEVSLEKQNEIVRFFCKHVVGLVGHYQILKQDGSPDGDPTFFCYSGFVISVRDHWFILTAGHAAKNVDDAIKSEQVEFLSASITDYFGNEARDNSNSIPYPIDRWQPFFEYDESQFLDYAIILVGDHERRLLEANGIAAMEERMWHCEPATGFEKFSLLGFPESMHNVERFRRNGDEFSAGGVVPVMLSIDTSEFQDDGEWLQGRLRATKHQLDSIVGMSGGPIFGFCPANEKGRWQYGIAAVQSSWNPKTRVIKGCRMSSFVNLIESTIASLQQQY